MTSTTVASTITSATTHTITGVVRHVARIARVLAPGLNGGTGGGEDCVWLVWYAAIDTPGSGTNCGCTAVVVARAPGASCIGAGCTGCVGVDGGVGVGGAGCVCEASRLIRFCKLSCCLLSISCCVDDGAFKAPLIPRSPAARMNIDEANAVSILPA